MAVWTIAKRGWGRNTKASSPIGKLERQKRNIGAFNLPTNQIKDQRKDDEGNVDRQSLTMFDGTEGKGKG